MCGIFLWISKNRPVDPTDAARALMTMEHRGPDYQGLYTWSRGAKGTVHDAQRVAAGLGVQPAPAKLAMGHARLSIIDLSKEARQPMIAPDQTVLSFNGTIYNYIELRRELEATGQTFCTGSDTEVLLHWLRKYGTEQINSLNGNWAFTFFDPRTETLVISRDPYGERPLFYYRDDDNFIVASEMKAIFEALGNPTRILDETWVGAYLSYQIWPNTDPSCTIYRNIRRLVPGSCIYFDLKIHTTKIRATHDIRQKPHPELATERIFSDVQRASEIRLRSDVPIGVFVSGGVDSTAVAAAIDAITDKPSDITFYTARFPGTISRDLYFARKVATDLGVELREIEIPFEIDAVQHLKTLTHQYDQPVPFAGTTFSESIMYQSMAADGIRVAITGTGGDEVFGGYGNEYTESAIFEQFSKGRLLNAAATLADALRNGWISLPAFAIFLLQNFRREPKNNSPFRNFGEFAQTGSEKIFTHANDYYWGRESFRSTLQDMQIYDSIHGRLSGFVAFADNNAMMHSIESRNPFLDPTLTKYMALPVHQKYHHRYNKFALRSSIPPTISSEVTWRREKQGFTYLFEQFYQSNRDQILSTIRDTRILNQLFRMDALVDALAGHILEREVFMSMFTVATFSDIFDCDFVLDDEQARAVPGIAEIAQAQDAGTAHHAV